MNGDIWESVWKTENIYKISSETKGALPPCYLTNNFKKMQEGPKN